MQTGSFMPLADNLFIYGTACIALFFLAIWWYRRKDKAFCWFAVTLLSWTLVYLDRQLPATIPWIPSLALSCWVISNALLAFHLAGLAPTAGQRMLFPVCATLVFVDDALLHVFMEWLLPMAGLSLLVLASGRVPGKTLVLDRSTSLMLVLTSLPFLGYPVSGWSPFWQLGTAVYILLALMLTHRFADALSEWEQLNSVLQERVRLEKDKIDQQYRKLIEVERANARMKERQRIFQDIHDDIGARLLTIVHLSNTEKDQALARKALQELRDIVSIKNRSQLDLGDAVADICTQTLHALENAGCGLNWIQAMDMPAVPMSESFFIDLKRAVRQAVALWIASADEGELTVRVILEAWQLQIRVSDLGTSCINTILENFQQSLARHGGDILLDTDLVFMVPLESETTLPLADMAV